MVMTYFKRFQMELAFDPDRLETLLSDEVPLPAGYEMVPFSRGILKEHATAKYESFRSELDCHVFACLGKLDGCLRLMREIAGRGNFLPESTWLGRYRDPSTGHHQPVATIQAIETDQWASIQNVGVVPEHRNRRLGEILIRLAARGAASSGLRGLQLEVTRENIAAIRFYERLGFRQTKTLYKACEV
ncbi:MAG: GNAT family N-acetyltransferase [Planctomycetota bacterium]